jgi:hypothetical protein
MKFEIDRAKTTIPDYSHSPVEGAVLKEFCMVYKKFNRNEKRWVIEINSLEELMDLIKKANRPLIISHSSAKELDGSVTIYDGYVE